MFKARAITEGAILTALYTILLLVTVYVPFLGFFSMFTLSIPFIVYAYRYPIKNVITFFVVALGMTYMLTGLLGLPMTFAFGTAGIAMGLVYVKGKSAFSILITGSITFIFNLLLVYAMSVLFFQINPVEQSKEIFLQSFETAETMIRGMGQEPEEQLEQMHKALEFVTFIIPSIVILAGILHALFTQILANQVLKRLQMTAIPTFPPFRQWRFPQSLLWYYLIVMILSFMDFDEGTTLYLIVVNAFMILQFVMVIQGLALLYYFTNVKGWSKVFPILITVFTFFIPILLYLIEFLGIIDLGFDLRKRIKIDS